jgi:hypothetical protein
MNCRPTPGSASIPSPPKRISSSVLEDPNGDGRPDIAYYGEPKELIVQYNGAPNRMEFPKRFLIDDLASARPTRSPPAISIAPNGPASCCWPKIMSGGWLKTRITPSGNQKNSVLRLPQIGSGARYRRRRARRDLLLVN